MRIVALLATYNEERFIAGCLEHLISEGIETYLIDNCSTDRTIAIASEYLGRGLIDIEHLDRAHGFSLRQQLVRKEQLAARLDADWFMHVDADEIHTSPWSGRRLADAFQELDARGYNVVNFREFTFIPTRESPDHDHANFQRTMRWYYPFATGFPRYMRAWKAQPVPVDLVHLGGHVLDFPGLRMWPEPFNLRHYMCLSRAHAIRKYAQRQFDPAELSAGWHQWRASLRPEMIHFPPQAELRTYVSDQLLDATSPRTRHFLDELGAVAAQPR